MSLCFVAAGCAALASLSGDFDNHAHLLDNGCLATLFAAMAHHPLDACLQLSACSCLFNLTFDPSGKSRLQRHADTVTLLRAAALVPDPDVRKWAQKVMDRLG